MTKGLNRRRGDEARVKAAAKEVVSRHRIHGNEVVDARVVGKAAAVHNADCSCMWCGNPRTHFNLKSIQERKAEQGIDDE